MARHKVIGQRSAWISLTSIFSTILTTWKRKNLNGGVELPLDFVQSDDSKKTYYEYRAGFTLIIAPRVGALFAKASYQPDHLLRSPR